MFLLGGKNLNGELNNAFNCQNKGKINSVCTVELQYIIQNYSMVITYYSFVFTNIFLVDLWGDKYPIFQIISLFRFLSFGSCNSRWQNITETLLFIFRVKQRCKVLERVNSSARRHTSGRRTEKPQGLDTWETAVESDRRELQ